MRCRVWLSVSAIRWAVAARATPDGGALIPGVAGNIFSHLFDALAGELEYVELDGEPSWVIAGDTGTPPHPHQERLAEGGPVGRPPAPGGASSWCLKVDPPARITHLSTA